jgi:Na+-driven multidrug efflux pump
MLKLMATDSSIIDASASYIRIESIANIFSILTQFALVALVTVNKSKYLYALTGARLVLCLVSDTFFVSTLPVSLDLGVNGIGYSNIIVNALLLITSLILLAKEEINVFAKEKLDFGWAKEFFKIGGVSGFESLVRNVAYMVMIARMVNVVGEQGTYWVANNFIWGWLLLPVIQLGELIKQEVSTDKENVRKNSLGYFSITAVISALWFVSIPVWKPFMVHVLGFTDVDKLFELVMVLVGFYVLYAIQNVFDATFYGLGKTNYMLFESVVTNTIYYGIAFILYATGAWTPTLIGIALLFGIGNAFDSIVSLVAYIFMLKKEKINLCNVE